MRGCRWSEIWNSKTGPSMPTGIQVAINRASQGAVKILSGTKGDPSIRAISIHLMNPL